MIVVEGVVVVGDRRAQVGGRGEGCERPGKGLQLRICDSE